jgi:uncharacterized integral membrane protein
MATDRQQTPKTTAEPTVPGPREGGPEQPVTRPDAVQPGAAPPDAAPPDAVQPDAAQPARPVQPGAGTAAPGTTGTTAPPHHALERTRIGGVWVATACFVVFLVLLLIFIAQNSRTVDISYLGAHGHFSLGVAMLLAAVCGALLVIFAGTARIMQLRATARKHRRADTKAAKAAR